MKTALPFAGLCDALEAGGFAMGTDQQIRLQIVLQTIGLECAGPEELRDVLCPIFATSAEEQAEFGRIYKRWWGAADVAVAPVAAVAVEPPPGRWWEREWVYWTAAVVLVAAIVWGAAYWLRSRPLPPPEEKPAVVETPPRTVTAGNRTVTVVEAVRRVPLPEPAMAQWWRAHRTEVLLAGWMGIAVWLAYELRRWRRRRMILRRSRRRFATPPYELALQLPHWTVPLPPLRKASGLLLRREWGRGTRLDVGGTLRATLRAGGYPQLRYRPERREPTYLLLIDRHSAKDHQAEVFGQLAAALRRLNVPATIYYFRGDPRYCERAADGGAVGLAELAGRHWAARLLVATDGERLRHPATGELLPWVANALGVWERRAILTPAPERAEWGDRERTLAAFFALEPATGEGIRRLAERWGAVTEPGEAAIPPGWEDGDRWSRASEEAAEELREYLREAGFRWVCACAIYPELQWDLTMHVGGLPGLGDGLAEPILTEGNWLRLANLAWFRRGWMPDEWRVLLAGQLTEAQERAVREEILRVLDRTELPKESAAGERRRLTMEHYQTFLEADGPERVRRLRRWLRREVVGAAARDAVLLQSIDAARDESLLDFVLPEGLARRLRAHGVSLFGLRTAVGLGAVVVAAVSLSAVAAFDEGWMTWNRQYASGTGGEWREAYVQIPAGTFLMGCSPGDGECQNDEKPAHEVRISKAFYLAETEVTEGNFAKYAVEAGLTRAREIDPNLPAVEVNLAQAKGYCEWSGGRLPTEAEWEYAARGGTTGARYGALDDIAWYSRNSGSGRHPVRAKLPNAYGLYDMLGNVWEWTADWYGSYDAGAAVDPKGPVTGGFRVLRGGGWFVNPGVLRASVRDNGYPEFAVSYFGFRCAREGF